MMFRRHYLIFAAVLSLAVAACGDDGGGADPSCGNGMIDGVEECDDGNRADGDGCSATCTSEGGVECGNGILEAGEECDDGNLVDGDGCQANCTNTRMTPEVTCKELAPLASGTCEVTAGDGQKLFVGTVLAPDKIYRGGEVLVDASGMITCVGCDCAAGASGATQIVCPQGVISPGLINTHEHITFANNSPYTDTGERYEHRHDWRRGLNGHTEINASGGASSDQIRWGELRFMLGGATSLVGSGSASGFLRNLDRSAQEGLGQTPVDYSTFPLGDSRGQQQEDNCSYPNIESLPAADAYVPHIAEGINLAAINEFVCTEGSAAGSVDLLEPKSAYIHAVGLKALQYSQMADQGTALIWSPRSNITLYGDTARVTTAARLGVLIALGTDWIPTGSMNLQRELQCADSLNRDYYNNQFSDRDLWAMVTGNAATAVAVDDVIGLLAAGKVGDIAIFDGSTNADYRAVIDAEPQDVTLVVRGGTVLYGDDALVGALAPGNCDAMDVCSVNKRLCAEDDIGKNFAALQTSVGNQYPVFMCGPPTNEPSCHPARSTSVSGSTIYDGNASATDADGDGVADASDNCPNVFNPIRPLDEGAQQDADNDGAGDECDVCPFDADTTTCSAIDPNDSDGDGVANATDNCPNDANMDQADGDSDGRGDVCDACPGDSNPAPLACPSSIYDIKQGTATGTVGINNALVTACADGRGYFVQVKEGDTGYAGSDYSGVFVFDRAVVCNTTLAPGDRVNLNPATVNDFFGQVQLNTATISVTSSGEALPAAVVVTPAAASGTTATPLEGVLVRVENVVVTDLAPAPGVADTPPTNEFEVGGSLRVNDLLYLTAPFPAMGAAFTSITGILDYRNGNSKLEPRNAADLVLGAPVLTGFDPGATFLREGDANAATIPDALTVSLSSAALTDTFVAIASNDAASLTVVGGGVTVLAGQSSAVVNLNGLQQSAGVTLTASLDTAMLTSDVRVVGAAEVPTVVAITPATADVFLMDAVDLTVSLDIPANGTNADISLATAPGTVGSVPAMVSVPADETTATFTFSAGASAGTETVTATLGASMATATVNVSVAPVGNLVINEVDYDNPGADVNEFVELYNASTGTVDLSTLALVFVNGSNDQEYSRVTLSGSLAPGEFLVVGSTTLLATVPMGVATIALSAADNNIQNGTPDAVGLFDTSTGTLIDALSYEGSLTAGTVGGAASPLNFVEGNATTAEDINGSAASLIRSPNGSDTDDANTDWQFTTTPTPGATNTP